MTDLHTQLAAKINARLELARAVPGPRWSDAEDDDGGHLVRVLSDDDQSDGWIVAEDTTGDVADFIAANDPASVIRFCERDLRVLARHAPAETWLTRPKGSVQVCAYEWGDGDGHAVAWHECPEVTDLADAYRVDLLVPTKEET